MKELQKMYEDLKRRGWRNPIDDQEYVEKKYQCPKIEYTLENIRNATAKIKQHIYKKYFERILFLTVTSPLMDS